MMRALSFLPLLSLAYAQGQDPLTTGNQALSNPFGEAEYNELCANPRDAEVELGPGLFFRYYYDTYPRQ